MKVVLLAVAFFFSTYLPAQTFRWDDQSSAQEQEEPKLATSETGMAMLYPDYYEGSPTALGEVFDQNELTGAHKKLPLGTVVQLTRLDNGMSVQVRINDRGAYCDECIVDITKAAAAKLDMLNAGQAKVRLTVLGERKATSNNTAAMAVAAPAEPRFTARGVGANHASTPARTVAAPAPNAYEQVQARTPVVETRQAAGPAASEEPTEQNCVIRGDYYDPNMQLKQVDGIAVLEMPFSPFSVQFGAYSKRANAERHVRKLLEAGFDNVFLLIESQVGKASLHRVITAPFTTLEEAKAYANDVQQLHDMRALVFQTTLVEVRD